MVKRFVYWVTKDWAQIKSCCSILNIRTGVTINYESLLPDDFGNEDFLNELVKQNIIKIRLKDDTK